MTHHDFARDWCHFGPTPYFGHTKKPVAKQGPGRSGPYGRRRKTAKCERYRAEARRERNRGRRLRRHCTHHPYDAQAARALKE